MLAGLVVSALVAAVALGPWLADMVRTGLVRENYAGRRVAFPAGRAAGRLLADRARAAGGARRPRRPRPARPRAAALDGLRARRRPARAARRRARPRRGRRHAPRLARPRPRGRSPGGFSTGAIKAVGALALAAYAVSGRGRQGIDYVADLALLLLATNLFNLLDLRPGRVEKAFVAAARRALPRRLDGRADRAARALHRPGRWSGACVHPARAGDARRHRLEPGRGARRDLDAGRRSATPGAGSPWRWSSALTIYGEFRSISQDDRVGSATALARLARQSESRDLTKR